MGRKKKKHCSVCLQHKLKWLYTDFLCYKVYSGSLGLPSLHLLMLIRIITNYVRYWCWISIIVLPWSRQCLSKTRWLFFSSYRFHYELAFTTQLSIRRELPWFDLSDYFYIYIFFFKSESSFLLICCFNCQKEAKALQFCAYTLAWLFILASQRHEETILFQVQESTVNIAALTSTLIWIKKCIYRYRNICHVNKTKQNKQDQLLRCFCPHWVFPAPRWRWRCCILLGWRGTPFPSVVPREELSSPVSGDQSQAFSGVWKAQPFEGGPGGKQGQTLGLRKSRDMFLLTALLLYYLFSFVQ